MDNRLIDYMSRLNGAESFVDAWGIYRDELSSLGLTESLYGCTVIPEGQRQAEDFLYLSNYNEGFIREYEDNQFSQHDVLVDWCEHNDKPIEWNSIDFELSSKQKEAEDLSADYKLQWGYTIPLRLLHGSSWGGTGICAAGISKKEFEKDVKPHFEYIQLITHTFHSFVQKFPRFTEAQGEHDFVIDVLSSNELETLRWLVQGCSIKEIASEKLHKSVDMVNKYINSAKKKMNARNRDQMIARALILGIV